MTLAERSATYDLPLTQKGVMRLTPRLRETHLTPENGEGCCITQAVGPCVYVWLFSDRDDIRLSLDLQAWDARRPYEQSVHRWGINVNRYNPDDTTGGIVVDRDGEKPTVEVAVETVEPEVTPDV